MARRIIISDAQRGELLLTETKAENEAQLQNLLKSNPDLIPLEELGLPESALVVGEETRLPSGAVDLLALTRDGHLLVVEFKTGPDNADFRRVLAQLLDYGSHLWGMSLEQFERDVAVRFFSSERCRVTRLRKVQSLEEAAKIHWSDLTEEEWFSLSENLASRLKSGTFEYIIAAQGFTATVERTVDYLNHVVRDSRFFAIEMVRFQGDDTEAFESRTVIKPSETKKPTRGNRWEFLKQIPEDIYRNAVGDFIDGCESLGLIIFWDAVGFSVRVRTRYRRQPLSVAWLFPPEKPGWMGLSGITLGYDGATIEGMDDAKDSFDWFIGELEGIDQVKQVSRSTLRGFQIPASVFQANVPRLLEILEKFAQRMGGSATG